MSKRLPKGPWATIVADPPWPEKFSDVFAPSQRRRDRGRLRIEGSGRRYSLMTYEAIAALPVVEITADSAHLYLWATQRSLERAWGIMRAWGFDYKMVLTWCKAMGLGFRYFRHSTEFCLFGTRGNLPTMANNIGTWFEAPKTGHSRKPDGFFEMVERVSLAPRLEMFARRKRRGWGVWGDEANQ